jgi:hypothetical protein
MLLSGALAQAADLLDKYNAVISRGGWLKVTGFTAWRELQQEFEFSQNLRTQYEEKLFCVEKSLHPQTLFSVSYDFFELEPNNISEAVSMLPPASAVADAAYWKTGFLAGLVVFRGFGTIVIGLRPALFQAEELSKFSDQVVVSQLDAQEPCSQQLTLSSYESWEEVCAKLNTTDSFRAELDLELYESAYSELANKMPKSLFCCSEDDCLKYLDWKIEGLNSPKLVLMNNSSYCIQDLPLLCMSKVLTNLGPGEIEIWGLDISYLPRVRERVKDKYGCALSDWKPCDEFFLSYNIPAHYLILTSGDLAILPSQKVYWLKTHSYSYMAFWSFLPYTLDAFANAVEVYKDNIQTALPNAVPLFTLMTTLLSQEAGCISEDLRLYCIQQVHSKLSNELISNEQAQVRTSAEHFCDKCNSELLCAYYLCSACESKDFCKACVEDGEEHLCEADPKPYLKFNDHLFIELLEHQSDSSKTYEDLRLLQGHPRQASDDVMVISSEKLSQLLGIKAPYCEQGGVKKKKPKSSSSSSVAPEGVLIVSGDPDFKLAPNKQKIKDAIQCPLTGPRFTYALDSMGRGLKAKKISSDLKTDLASLIYKSEPKYYTPKATDPDQMHKNLSILVRTATREDLIKKKAQTVSQQVSTKMQFGEEELNFAIPRKKHKS